MCCGCGRVCRCVLCGCVVGVDGYVGVCCVGTYVVGVDEYVCT